MFHVFPDQNLQISCLSCRCLLKINKLNKFSIFLYHVGSESGIQKRNSKNILIILQSTMIYMFMKLFIFLIMNKSWAH